jgi:hypothetical protein
LNLKSYLVAIMLTALMLALMFIPISGSQSTKQYDPWLDYNDDGKISLADLVFTSTIIRNNRRPNKICIYDTSPLSSVKNFQ